MPDQDPDGFYIGTYTVRLVSVEGGEESDDSGDEASPAAAESRPRGSLAVGFAATAAAAALI